MKLEPASKGFYREYWSLIQLSLIEAVSEGTRLLREAEMGSGLESQLCESDTDDCSQVFGLLRSSDNIVQMVALCFSGTKIIAREGTTPISYTVYCTSYPGGMLT